ncbi:MAG: MoaD/ThiS family protein [Bacillota bacterium]
MNEAASDGVSSSVSDAADSGVSNSVNGGITMVGIEVLGHLIFYLPSESRKGNVAIVSVPVGTTVGQLPDLLSIPRHEIQAILVNGDTARDPSAALGPHDKVTVLPIISGG